MGRLARESLLPDSIDDEADNTYGGRLGRSTRALLGCAAQQT